MGDGAAADGEDGGQSQQDEAPRGGSGQGLGQGLEDGVDRPGELAVGPLELTAAQAGTLQRLDIVYGVSAAIVLITGILRIFLEKGPAYYNHHIGFHILFGIFVVTALISIYLTLIFLSWRSDTSAGRGQQLAQDQFKKIQMILRVEMTLLLLAPFFATWMAHGEF